MATFPAIKPNGRSLNLGDYPQLEYVGTSGVSTRFLQNTKRVRQTLTLTYNSLTETNINAIYNHFDGQQGSLIPFTLPSEIWAGYSSIPISTLDYEWRYSGPLSITPTAPGRFNVVVELESDLL
jgi:hypothetical protein